MNYEEPPVDVSNDEEYSFQEWVSYGVAQGWVGFPKCGTHDGSDFTEQEELEFEDGGYPCFTVMSVW